MYRGRGSERDWCMPWSRKYQRKEKGSIGIVLLGVGVEVGWSREVKSRIRVE